MDVVASTIATAAASLAAVVDVRSRRIPNWLTGSLVLGGLVFNLWRGGMVGVGLALAGAALGLAILLPFYAVRAIGAGDVKLLAGLGAILGPQALLSVAIYAALAGGVISAIMLARGGRLLSVMREMLIEHRPPTRGGATAPYGLAIASGMYLSLVLPGVLG
jgi:prepilin peptidase CpaA